MRYKNLGYRVYGGDKNLLKFSDSQSLKEYIQQLMENWDAVQDMPWPLYYKELYQLFPDAKFILSVRPTDKWIRSVVKYFASIRVPMHQKIYNVPCAEGYEDRYIEVYDQHNQYVKAFFEGKSNFIIMEQGHNFNYDTLCKFLGIEDIPAVAFPHARNNKKRKLPNYKLYRDLRSLYWNFKKKY